MQRYKIISVLLCSVLLCPFARAQKTVSPRELRSDVEFLSDTLCAGRGSGTRGAQEAAFYIFRQLGSISGLDVRSESYVFSGRTGHNIVARSNNYAPDDPVILVMAYYDGLGTVDGKVFPGADANASGVAALLGLARSLEGLRSASGRDFVFAAVDSHHSGMEGAAELSRRYRPSMVINLDTVGSTLAPVTAGIGNYLIALGAREYASTLEWADIHGEMHFYYDYYRSGSFTELFYTRLSDHRFWLGRGIPCIMFTSGITTNTNKDYDIASMLDYGVFAERVNIISRWLKAR